jgi:hypothetical protein
MARNITYREALNEALAERDRRARTTPGAACSA